MIYKFCKHSYLRCCLSFLSIFLQRPIEKIRQKRKRQKALKRIRIKANYQNESSSNHKLVHDHDAVNNEQQNLKIDIKEVDIMLLANLKQKAIKWRKAAEAYEQEETSGCVEDIVDSEILKDNKTKPMPSKEESDNAYFQLMKQSNQQSQLHDDSSPSLLLPAYVPPLQEITIQVKGKDIVENLTAKQYITSLIKERDEAIMSAQMCRNKVDELRTAYRRIY